MQTRREFLGTLGLGALGAATLACTRTNGQTANPSAVMPLGIQLYTVRSLMERDFEGTLARIAEIGYREVEFAGYFKHTPEQVRDILRRTGLTAPSAHIPLPATDADWQRALDAAKIIGHQWAVIPFLDPSQRNNFPALADKLNHVAALTQAAGLRQAYHNHDFEFAANGPDGNFLDLLLTRTDPKLVSFEMDVYWVTKAGADPLALMAKYPGRFPLLHLKDATPAPERRMADVGHGTIDWTAVLRTARAQGLQHVFVERDDAPDPLASARASYTYLASLRA